MRISRKLAKEVYDKMKELVCDSERVCRRLGIVSSNLSIREKRRVVLPALTPIFRLQPLMPT